MSTKILRILMLVLLMCGAGVASAQMNLRTYTVPPLKLELREMADRIVELRNDSLTKSSLRKADALFQEMARPLADSIDDMVAVGAYMIDKGEYTIPEFFARRIIATASERMKGKKDQHDSIPYLMFEGEVFTKVKDWRTAAEAYYSVLDQDSTNFTALYYGARAYRGENPTASMEYYQRLKAAYPHFYQADQEMGDMYYENKDYLLGRDLDAVKQKALKHYNDYFNAVPRDRDSINFTSCDNYLILLYELKEKKRLDEVVTTFLPLYPEDKSGQRMVRRMDFFTKFERFTDALVEVDANIGTSGIIEDVAKAQAVADETLQAMSYLSNKDYADSLYIFADYQYAAQTHKNIAYLYNVLKEEYLGREDSLNEARCQQERLAHTHKAIDWFRQAVTNDTSKVNAYYDMAELYRDIDEYDKSIAAFEVYYKALGQAWTIDQEYYYGTRLYQASSKPSVSEENRAIYKQRAMDTFKDIVRQQPDYVKAIAYIARGSIVDSSKPEDAPRDCYLQLLDASEAKADEFSSYRLEACKYLIFYAVQVEPMDLQLLRKAYDKARAIDPGDEQVVQVGQFLRSLNRR